MQHTSGLIGTTEPTLADLFSDPITYGMMAADHVDYGDLQALLLTAQHFAVVSDRNHVDYHRRRLVVPYRPAAVN